MLKKIIQHQNILLLRTNDKMPVGVSNASISYCVCKYVVVMGSSQILRGEERVEWLPNPECLCMHVLNGWLPLLLCQTTTALFVIT